MLTELNKSNPKSSAKSTNSGLFKYLKNKSDTLYVYFSEQ